MSVDLMRGLPKDLPAGAQENDGGITVALMQDGAIRLLDRSKGEGWEIPPFQAMDIGQRLIQMSMMSLQRTFAELVSDGPRETNTKPKIDIVRATLPKGAKLT